MTAASIITRAVQSTPVKQVGYSGLMVPVLEDDVLAKRWAEGTYNMDSLLAYSAVCAGGLGHGSAAPAISRKSGSRKHSGRRGVARVKWRKPLAARLLPRPGREGGGSDRFRRCADGQHGDPLIGEQTEHSPISNQRTLKTLGISRTIRRRSRDRSTWFLRWSADNWGMSRLSPICLVVVNAASGGRCGSRASGNCSAELLHQAGLQPEIVDIHHGEQLQAAIDRDTPNVVVAAGGDGTVSAVAARIFGTERSSA